jgi:hypothetical protein
LLRQKHPHYRGFRILGCGIQFGYFWLCVKLKINIVPKKTDSAKLVQGNKKM